MLSLKPRLMAGRIRTPSPKARTAQAGGDVGAESGLHFPANFTANSIIRCIWATGTTGLSRTSCTIIRKVCWIQQNGFYAWGWFSRNTLDGNFDGAWSLGFHPYPGGSGAVNGQGAATDGQGDSGTVHYHELGSLGNLDYLASPGGSAVVVTKGTALSPVWYTQALTAEVSGANVIHTFYLDLDNNPSQTIVQSYALASIGSPNANDVLYNGSSEWRDDHPSSGQTDESPGCITRLHKFFTAPLTLADIQSEKVESNAPQTSAGAASIWYSNVNPTPSDVTDKSGQGNHPSWFNANRPALWTP